MGAPAQRSSAGRTSSSAIPAFWLRNGPPLVLVLAVAATYANSFRGVFLFDDHYNIHDQAAVHALWPPDWLNTQRPLTNLSFALNWAAGGTRAWGYHLVNLAVHLGAALLLYGCVRRTALTRLGAPAARGVALAASLLWALHPLQTQSVTYIVQRGEALAGLLVLATLYGAIRALAAARAGARRGWWLLAIGACALAQTAKPIALTAPVLVGLYDLLLAFPSWRAALRARWPLYLGLIATWGVTVGLGVVSSLVAPQDAVVTVGAGSGVGPWVYLCTQAGVIVYYLRLAFWPDPLVLDYGWPWARGLADAWLPGMVVLGLLAVAVASWRRRPWLSFCLLWFFIGLAPTSSVVPIVDALFEHRVYLPLAGLIAALVVIGWAGLRRLLVDPARVRVSAGLLAGVLSAALMARTIVRNRDYHDPVRLWERNARARPENPRAHNNLCQALNEAGRDAEALSACDAALRLAPDYADAWNNRANVLLGLNEPAPAAEACARALAIREQFADAHVTCGYALTLLGRLDEAIAHERAALAIAPDNVQALNNLGNALAQRGENAEARAAFERALALAPERADTHNNVAWLLAAEGDLAGAAAQFERALALSPELLTAQVNLGEIYHRLGRDDAARTIWQEALRNAQAAGRPNDVALIRSRLVKLNAR